MFLIFHHYFQTNFNGDLTLPSFTKITGSLRKASSPLFVYSDLFILFINSQLGYDLSSSLATLKHCLILSINNLLANFDIRFASLSCTALPY